MNERNPTNLNAVTDRFTVIVTNRNDCCIYIKIASEMTDAMQVVS